MTQRLRRTVRSFLRTERPATPEAAREVLDEWFGRYHPDPRLLDQEVARHFALVAPPRDAKAAIARALGG
jgi:hypothetical protein